MQVNAPRPLRADEYTLAIAFHKLSLQVKKIKCQIQNYLDSIDTHHINKVTQCSQSKSSVVVCAEQVIINIRQSHAFLVSVKNI